MKKNNASLDNMEEEGNFLTAETLRRATQMICKNGVRVSAVDAEPAPLEMLGLTIGILRRRKHISRLQFSQKIGCTVEELLALEAGLFPASELAIYLPLILKEIETPGISLQPFLRNIEFA